MSTSILYGPDIKVLYLDSGLVDIKIVQTKATKIEVVTDSPASTDFIGTIKDGDELHLDLPLPFKEDHLTTKNQFISSYGMHNGHLFVNGKEVDLAKKATAVIKIPAGTNLVIGSIFGKVTSGDLNGKLFIKNTSMLTQTDIGNCHYLQIDAESSGAINVGNIATDAIIQSSSIGIINIGNIDGRLSAQLSSIGNVTLGNIKQDSSITISGSGSLEMGSTNGLDATLTSIGKLQLKNCSESLKARISGSGLLEAESFVGETIDLKLTSIGKATINRGVTKMVQAEVTGSGSLVFQGNTVDATLIATSIGEIHVDRCLKQPVTKEGHFKKIFVKQIG